jgi:NADPH-dependent 2,4-dienoyl-CoA reductase/sulfur reductase-like enzyme
LLGKAAAADAPIAGPKGLAGHGVSLECDTRCTVIDRMTQEIVTASGRRFGYDALVVATGSVVRQIPALPLGAPRVHYLRTEAHARAIGLEVAASASELGVRVTVIEILPRILARVCDEDTSARVDDAHRRRGVGLRLNTVLTHAQAEPGGRIALKTGTNETLIADLVVVGAGAVPDDRLAAATGLRTDNGIVVDAQCRTSDPKIFAAGDVVRFPGPQGLVRREDWRHAQDQGAVAGRNAAGASDEYHGLPSFWSEQFDLYIQGVGSRPAKPDRRVRRLGAAASQISLELIGPHVAYALGINAQRDIAVVRRLIERQIAVDPVALADPTKPLADILKAKGAGR